MKKLALATAFLFASSMFVMAQSTTSPSSTDQQQPSATSPSTTSPSSSQSSTMGADQSSQSGAMGSQTSTSGQESIQGCLSQGANGYTLAASSGTTYNLTGDASKLASHVGEQVQVKGSASGSSSAASTTGSPDQTGAAGTESGAGSNQSFNVQSVKRISKSCSTSGSPSSK